MTPEQALAVTACLSGGVFFGTVWLVLRWRQSDLRAAQEREQALARAVSACQCPPPPPIDRVPWTAEGGAPSQTRLQAVDGVVGDVLARRAGSR